ncbi:hypothetical protein SAMN02745121_00424 [Nannocystis exedens]|uniref:Uncharacterized protein n=1 Tax=Nannocystis exedens TaxID=54 RepID=A0A1I1T162_9BACT|nr:hypothetical protein [Nannocystis exedens]PCC66848.1 hypothetical protein NAEX_09444 [Nannocystis exedens]SFD52429.1 hypothetical protein SAMN02745121_00424 [Nannocystis exedens]
MAPNSGPEAGRAPQGSPGALRRLHDRHAERLRTAARWLGIDDHERDAAVTWCFRSVAAAVPEDSAAGWAALMRALARARPSGVPPGPRASGEAALLAFLGRRTAEERAVFALAELGGFDAVQLAQAIGAPPAAGQALIVGLRRAFAADPAVLAAGGPASVLAESVVVDRAPPGWRAQAMAELLGMSGEPGEPGIPRAAAAAVAILAVAVLVALRPRAPVPEPTLDPAAVASERPPLHEAAVPTPPPPIEAPPILPPVLGEPKDMAKSTGPARQVVVRKKGGRGPGVEAKKAAQAQREAEAAAKDPGNVIVELEMLGAARKALKGSPGQALAYADQHARDYPNSQLVEHRAEVRVRALCALGRADEARAEAQRRPWPKVQAALREGCGK